jgi:hypothetical protein
MTYRRHRHHYRRSYTPRNHSTSGGSTSTPAFSATTEMLNDYRSYGRDYVQQKYKLTTANLNKIASSINTAAAGKTSPAAKTSGYTARGSALTHGGPADPALANANENAAFKRKLQLNLENDEELAQGQQHPWAQSTSISSLITSQLRQAQNAPADYFDAWAASKSGKTELLARDSSSFGMDVKYSDAPEEQVAAMGPNSAQAESDVMGAFGTPMVMDPYYGEQQTLLDQDATNLASSQLKNPWAEGYGGATNSYGPSSQSMAYSTIEAMSLANAYFAPQRMELAYQLGDMETDMRRLAVNLGRQVDDPVLQAKLYKEGMRAVRTLDVQQNTMAFQMADARRKEELANFQFYDQLAQQEYQLRLANQQFYDRLELDNAYFGLQKDQLAMAADSANKPTADTSAITGTNTGTSTQTNQPAQQVQYPTGVVQPTITAGNLLNIRR